MAFQIKGEDKITYDNLNNNVTTLMQPKNWIINGGFDVWQRGISQTLSGYGSDDRWANWHHYATTKTHSQQHFSVGQTEVPNSPTYFSRTVTNGVSGGHTLKAQNIEDVTKLASKTVTVSFWAKADANKNISISFDQAFGSGGSTAVANIGVKKFAVTTSWQRYTHTVVLPNISGKTIGANHYTAFNIWFDASSTFNAATDTLGNQSGTFDIANVSLVEGSVPVEWQTEAYADVLRQCQRYYYRLGGEAIYNYFGQGPAQNTNYFRCLIQFPVAMRSIPSSSIDLSAMSTFLCENSDSVTTNTPTSITLSIVSSSKIGALNITKSASFTSGVVYNLLAYNTTSAYVGFSAEL